MFTYLNVPRVLLDIVDEDWEKDALPDDSELATLSSNLPLQVIRAEDEGEAVQEENGDAWPDLGLEDFLQTK